MTINDTIEEAKKIGIKDTSWKAWFMIVTILMAASVAAYYGVNVSVNVNLNERINILEGMLSHTINSTFYTLQKSASYIISVVSSGGTDYYCMQNGTTGKLDNYSTNASAVINNAIGNSSVGEQIFFKSGIYPIKYNLTLTITASNITFCGEGASSILRLSQNYTSMFTINGANDVTFLNLAFDGNKNGEASVQDAGHSTGAGISYSSGHNLRVDNCRFFNFINHAFVSPVAASATHAIVTGCYFSGSAWWDIAFAGGNYCIVSNCVFNSTVGIELGSTSGVSYYNVASSNTFYNCTGIYVGVGGHGAVVQGNTLYNCITTISEYPIHISGNNVTVNGNIVDTYNVDWGYALCLQGHDNQIVNNRFVNIQGTNVKAIGIVSGDRNFVSSNKISNSAGYGIYIHDATNENNVITDNTMSSCGTYFSDAGTNTIWGYGNTINNLPCENSVSGANTTLTTAVINHGLAAAATYVWCSFNDTSILSYTWTSTATQITITVTGTLPAAWTCYAKVEYVP